jgi:hypothetical protein
MLLVNHEAPSPGEQGIDDARLGKDRDVARAEQLGLCLHVGQRNAAQRAHERGAVKLSHGGANWRPSPYAVAGFQAPKKRS